ncbi:dipeptidase [Winogradskyella sp. DF17]|uniref:Dipeptidase n=1 Tax=Winogradskyella pelagia TaxID=2819984 RepID=A0ABS3T4X8_9FLAO|nr:dipeptidase [Winogradskyella sp. DF17]MBO3117795.1 dipeptidase [Winogradskyella sp. DF17]
MTLKITIPLFVLTILLSSCKPDKPKTDEELITYAKNIHKRVITLDTHCDINVKNFTDSINYTQRLDTQVNLPKMIEGGLDVVWFIVYTGQDSLTVEGFEKAYDNAISKFDAIHRLVNEYAPGKIELATTSEDVRRLQAKGKKVAMIGIENGYPIGLNLSNVKKFYDKGARYMSLSHNGHSQLCDSNTGESDGVWLHNGLSDFGKEVIKEMNRVGMMIDVSHPSKEAMRQMIELTKAPIIASHSSARALCNHSRNLDDEQLQWLKDNRGVIQTVAFKSYVSEEKSIARSKKTKEISKSIADSMGVTYYSRRELRNIDKQKRDSIIDSGYLQKINTLARTKISNMEGFPPEVNVSDFVDHIDYLVKTIGIDHVGISSDFDGGGGIEGWSDASETLNVTLELVRRGYTEEQIEKLWSGNLLRVLDEVQNVAKNYDLINSNS